MSGKRAAGVGDGSVGDGTRTEHNRSYNASQGAVKAGQCHKLATASPECRLFAAKKVRDAWGLFLSPIVKNYLSVNPEIGSAISPASRMRPLSHLAAVLGVIGGVAGPALAQEAPRYSIAGEESALAKRAALDAAPYSFRYERLKAQIETGLNLEANDNINLADTGRQRDLIVRPQVQLRSYFPVTTINSLNLSVGVSPALYVQHSEYNRVLITPGSELAMDLYLGDFLLNFHDQFSYTQDPVAVGSVSGSAAFGGFNNRAGTRLIGDFNELILSLGYDHVSFLSSTRQFEQLDNAAETVAAHGTLQFNRTLSVGLSATAGFTHYDQNFLNDHRSYSVGLDAALAVTQRLKVSAEAGLSLYDFDSGGTVGQTPSQQSYYFGLSAEHRLGQEFGHTLRASRELQQGIASDVIEVWSVRYQMDFKVTQQTSLSPRFFYENGRELKAAGGESYDRFGCGAALTRQLSERLRGGLGYSFTLKDSDLALRSYRQNSVTVDLSYRF